MKRVLQTLLLGSALVPIGAFGLAQAHDHDVLRGRLVFADHTKPIIRILDLDTGKVTHSVDTTKPDATLLPTDGGQYVIVRTGDDQGTVQILDSGIFREAHEDHFDIDKGDVRLLDLAITGDRPSHVVSEHGWVSVFYDGQRPWLGKSIHKSVNVRLDSLTSTEPEVTTWESPAPQHGISIPLADNEWLISISKDAYANATAEVKGVTSRPNGFQVLDAANGWGTVASFNNATDPNRSCKEFHGHAALNEIHVFGCNSELGSDPLSDGGLLILKKEAGQWSGRKLPYPDNRRTSTIAAPTHGQYVIANYGGVGGQPFDALLRINPTADSLSQDDVLQIPNGQEVCQFTVTADGRRVANLTPDGLLHIYDVAPAWKEVAVFEAVAPFDCAYDAQTPTPTAAIVGNSVYVSDPTEGRIREFYLNSLQQGLDYAVGETPTKIAGGGNAG